MKTLYRTIMLLQAIAVMLAMGFWSEAYAQDRAVKFGVDIHAGLGIDELSHYSVGADIICAWQANNYVQLGAGAGYLRTDALVSMGMGGEYRTEYKGFDGIRLFVREKASLFDGRVSPFVWFDEGGTIGLKRSGARIGRQATQLFFEPGAGVDFQQKGGSRISVSLGYLSQHTSYSSYTIAKDGKSMLDNTRMTDFMGQLTLHVGVMF